MRFSTTTSDAEIRLSLDHDPIHTFGRYTITDIYPSEVYLFAEPFPELFGIPTPTWGYLPLIVKAWHQAYDPTLESHWFSTWFLPKQCYIH